MRMRIDLELAKKCVVHVHVDLVYVSLAWTNPAYYYRVATSIKIHYYIVCRVCIFWFLVGVAHYGMAEVWAAMLR